VGCGSPTEQWVRGYLPGLFTEAAPPELLQEAVAAELHRGIPGSRPVVLPGVGHASNMEAPERFNAEVREFLRSVP
jgi:pimeloyl-ACP methyl ester carboxylesterase